MLKQNFKADAPDKIWVTDITYIPTDEGWLYCAAHKDLFNGEIVGYALGSRITKNLVVRSLLMAIRTKRPEPGLVNHYCSRDYMNQPSMSRKGNCYDNAPMESF